MIDGTVKQVNPFTGTEVWSVPGRGVKPLGNGSDAVPAPIEIHRPEDHCSFCESRYFEIPPEKSRLVMRNGGYHRIDRLAPSEYFNESASFRRTGNLFEIVSLDYWRKNYSYKLSDVNRAWKERYIADPAGLKHIVDIIEYKLILQGKEADAARLSTEEYLHLADPLFGGCHEMITARRHFREGAKREDDIYFSGDMSEEEHYQYCLFTIDAMTDIAVNNRYVRYVSIFQNWLRPAGASFDHLHKQLVGLDEWGASITRQIRMINKDRNVFNTYGPNFAGHRNLIFAENDFGVAFVGIGHRYPTLEIYSKSVHSRPHEHSPEEIRGITNLLHACHAALGRRMSCNEEWYYTPFDSIVHMPWHINIKLRISTPAGFEGGTGIFINPMTPIDLRDRIVPELYRLRDVGHVNRSIRIAEECNVSPNPLLYYKNF